MKNLLSLFILFLFILNLTSCGSGPLLRSDPSLSKQNTIKKITLLATSTVHWPSLGSGSPVIGIQSSKSGLEKILPMFKSHLQQMGYVVVFAEPIAAGIPFKSFKNHSAFEDYAKDGNKSLKPNISGDEPAYVYPVSNQEILNSAIALAFEISDSIADKEFANYQPSLNHIQKIANATGADTVCQIRALGTRYTGARTVGEIFRALFTYYISNTSDSGEFAFVCSDKTGKVLWQISHPIDNDPMDVSASHIVETLEHFPKAGESMQYKCDNDCYGSTNTEQHILSKLEVQTLLNDKTVEGYNVRRDFDFKLYFSPDGKLYSNNPRHGDRVGIWHASTEGLCWQFNSSYVKCARVELFNGNKYRRYNQKGNKVRQIYHKIIPGNQIKSE